jgi:hypothetical protein
MLQQKFNASGPEAPGAADLARIRLVGEEVDAVLATAVPELAPGASRVMGMQVPGLREAGFRTLPMGPILLAALAALVAFLGWRAWMAVETAMPARPRFAATAPEDVSILGRFDPFFRAGVASGDSLPVSSLPLALKGIRLDTASGRGSAIVAGADGVQVLLAPGEEAMPGVRIRSLAIDHIVLDNSGTLEALWLDEAGVTAQPLAQPNAPAGLSGASGQAGDRAAAGSDGNAPEAREDPLPDPAPDAGEED